MKEESYIRNVKYFLEELIRGCGIIQKENPAVQFTKDAKAGLYLLQSRKPHPHQSVGAVQKTVGFLANFSKIRYYIKNNEKFFCDNMHFDVNYHTPKGMWFYGDRNL